ncbi:MAG: PmoA family protein [Planctomycetota bacterium]|jgi:L-alanine-DL-glutamate epimerase-like enolase superfamily enzyme|nr:PmoA family protein [Planctomycetota bacterium]
MTETTGLDFSRLNRRRFLETCGAVPLFAAWARGRALLGGEERIERIEAFALRYPMTGHFKFFTGPHGAKGRASVLVKITTTDGLVGWGQSVPIARWSYETLETVETVLREYFAPALLEHDAADIEGAHGVMGKAVANGFSSGMPIARAGIDLALHDLAGKRAGTSVAALWGREARTPLRLSWTLNPRNLDEVEGLVAEGKRRGYRDFNIKVAPDPVFDVELARQVRQLAPEAFLWADANGGYSPEAALEVAPKLAEAGVDVFEAPLQPNRIAGYQALKKQGALPILMDEGVVSPVELGEFIRLGMIDGVAMKPSRCGGLQSARRQIELLETEGLMWLGSGLTDPDVSLAATLQLYGAYGLKHPAALNGPQFVTASVLREPLAVVDGAMTPPDGPGFGVEVDEDALRDLVRTTRGAAVVASAARYAGELDWDEDGAGSVALRADGQDLWRFHHGASQPHAYFHPLALPGMDALTVEAPSDHVHHHGFWFSWKYINGVNYWENAAGSDRPAGRTTWERVRTELRPDHSARIRMRLSYASPEGERVLSEVREIELSSPAADGSYAMEWTGHFTALAEEVVLDRTPLPGEPDGRVFGGYAGLSLRLTQLEDRAAVTPEGPVVYNEEQRFRGRAAAFDYHGKLGGADAGIAVVASRTNLNAPSPWYAIRSGNMSFFSPAVICYGPHELRRGDGFTLRYRIVVHPGRWTSERLRQELRD